MLGHGSRKLRLVGELIDRRVSSTPLLGVLAPPGLLHSLTQPVHRVQGLAALDSLLQPAAKRTRLSHQLGETTLLDLASSECLQPFDAAENLRVLQTHDLGSRRKWWGRWHGHDQRRSEGRRREGHSPEVTPHHRRTHAFAPGSPQVRRRSRRGNVAQRTAAPLPGGHDRLLGL